ncbi:mutator protein MutT [Paenibacillus sp. SORGH_AS306]|uniref:NUDIX domain-containing protein n=1 Tax=unclassified Paenibacillus TaxID=185978 RepID=UPI00277E15BE|nr:MULTISPECIES: NUDIX domain-containing protein [unclassified Paenibacillus]MDQ1233870.1 mutator protein MutT [Paenibacillus sp. SORGH_AS_0306]MDR6110915.1 mutator protein MutT [Paenibacillus sp. SORGH_AS_0338]
MEHSDQERQIIVTGGAIIRDEQNRILWQKRSDSNDWGLPGGGMHAGETIEETMLREVKEETGLAVISSTLYAVYSGERLKYTYPGGDDVVFVMFIFDVVADLEGKLAEDGKTLRFEDDESVKLLFYKLEAMNIEQINPAQRPLIEDLMAADQQQGILRN